MLLNKGAEVNSKDIGGRTPLSLAVSSNRGRTPLSWAVCGYNDWAIAKLLLDSGADVNADGNSGRTPLSWAAAKGNFSVTRVLLDSENININLKDIKPRWSPLFMATVKGHMVVVRQLLEIGRADINARDNWGRTCLSLAAVNGREGIVSLHRREGKLNMVT